MRVWGPGVTLFVTLGGRVGFVGPRGPEVGEDAIKVHGWEVATVESVSSVGGCRHARAVYAVQGDGEVMVMGLGKDPPLLNPTGLSATPLFGPPRDPDRGFLGGLNFSTDFTRRAAKEALYEAAKPPGSAYVIQGTDDWDAPAGARVTEILRAAQVWPLAWWHTGASGLVPSGAIVGRKGFLAARDEAARMGSSIVLGGDSDPLEPPSRRPCGCWDGYLPSAMRLG